MPLSAGDRLGPYEVTGELGAGGMGIVLRARDITLDRDVALKVPVGGTGHRSRRRLATQPGCYGAGASMTSTSSRSVPVLRMP